jgi:uncharacterized protein (DUF302 family)
VNQRKELASFVASRAEVFIRGESTLSLVCERLIDDVAVRLEASIAANDLVILHVHDFGRMLKSKGLPLDLQCRVYEVCNPLLASQLIALDPGLAHVLPSRISMHEQGGFTKITMPMPTAFITEFSHAAEVARLAHRLEARLQRALKGTR